MDQVKSDRARSDLVTHFKLDARVYDDHTVIVKNVPGKRYAKKEEKWFRTDKKPLGGGTFGDVWREHEQENPGVFRAVKVIRKPSTCRGAQQECEKELYALAALSKYQDNVAEFYGWWEDDYRVFLSMEYFKHRDLINCVRTPLPEAEVVDITSQILEALKILHAMGFTHRDLKLQNILVAETGPQWWVKLGDFGISKRIGVDTFMNTKGTGTVAYMAPEVLDEDSEDSYTNKVDIWATGCIAYVLLTLDMLFNNKKTVRKYANDQAPMDIAWQKLRDRNVSQACIHFLKEMVAPKAESRPSAESALESTWIKHHAPVKSEKAAESESDDSTDNETFASPFNKKDPFESTFVTSVNTVGTTSWVNVAPNPKSQPTLRSLTSDNTLKSSPTPAKTFEPAKAETNSNCTSRCKCAICLECSWNVDPNSNRNEYVMHSCGAGCFGLQPLCTECLKRGPAGYLICPRCKEVPNETRTRNRHQSSAQNSENASTVKSPQVESQSEASKMSPYTGVQPAPATQPKSPPAAVASPTPLSQQSTLAPAAPEAIKSPTSAQAAPAPTSAPTPAGTTSVQQEQDSIYLARAATSFECRICTEYGTGDSWVCVACKDSGNASRSCMKCVPRAFQESPAMLSGRQTRTCGVCSSSRCYLLSREEEIIRPDTPPRMETPSRFDYSSRIDPYSSLYDSYSRLDPFSRYPPPPPLLDPLDSLSYLSSALPPPSTSACTVRCKCDRCGTCALLCSSHWKCKLCLRPRCADCAGVTSGKPVPWCYNPSCDYEMLSLAERNKIAALNEPVATTLMSMFRRTPMRPLCVALGCSCDRCGECSQRLHTYRCRRCESSPFALTVKHMCQKCIHEPLIIGELPMCPDCEGTSFKVYAPKM